MPIGQNTPLANPVQYVNPARPGPFVDPKNYSQPNYNAQAFRPQETMQLVQQGLQEQARFSAAQDAADEARPWEMLNNVLSIMDKSQPNIQRLQYEEAAKTNAALNSDLNRINTLYERAAKGDMSAQEELANFTFNTDVLEKAPVDKFVALKDALTKAQVSVANSGAISAMNKVKLSLKNTVENLVGDNNPEAATLASAIARAIVQSGQGAIQPEVMEELQNRIKVYRYNNPGSAAADMGIIDNYRRDMEVAQAKMQQERLYGDQRLSSRDAVSAIGKLAGLANDPTLPEEEKLMYKGALQKLLMETGMLDAGMVMPGPSGTTGTQEGNGNPALEAIKRFFGGQ